MKFLLPKQVKSIARAVICSLTLVLAVPAPSFADAKMDQIFNNEAIQRYLAELNSKVGYLTRLKMMRAHLAASALNVNAGRNDDATKHVSHPKKEIWAEMVEAMTEADAKNLKLPCTTPCILSASTKLLKL
jgi:hypothetical protein